MSLTTGNRNVYVGALSGDANVTGDGNTAIGHNTLSTNTHSENNVAVGYEALKTFNVGSGSGFGSGSGVGIGCGTGTGSGTGGVTSSVLTTLISSDISLSLVSGEIIPVVPIAIAATIMINSSIESLYFINNEILLHYFVNMYDLGCCGYLDF